MIYKKMLWLALVLVLATGVAFANGGQDKMSGKVVLNVLSYGDLTTPEGKAYLEIRDAFLKANPNITIKDESLYDESYHQKLQALLAAGNVPDIIYMWPSGDRTKPLIDAGQQIDQAQFIETSKFKSAAVTGQGPNGMLLTVPIGVGAHGVMFANTEILTKLGLKEAKTYAELKDQAAKLSAAGITPVAMANADTWVNGTCLFSTLLGRFGGANWVSDLAAGKAKFTDPVAMNALTVVANMYKDGILVKQSVQTDYQTALSMFVNGEAAYMIDGGWRAGGFDAAFAAKVSWNAFPAVPGEKFPGSINGGVTPGYSITKAATADATKLAAAKKLFQYLTGEEANKVRAKVQGIIPAYNVSGKIEYYPGTEAQATFIATAPLLTLTMDNIITGEPVTVCNTGLQELGTGAKTPAQVADAVQKALGK